MDYNIAADTEVADIVVVDKVVADKGIADMDSAVVVSAHMDFAVAVSAHMDFAVAVFAYMDFAVAVFVYMDSAVVEFVHLNSVDCYPDSMYSAATGFAHCFGYCHLIHSHRNSSQSLRIFIINNIIIVYEMIRVNICKKIKKKDAYASLVFEI